MRNLTTLGVEEEYLLLEPDTGVPVPASDRVRAAADAAGPGVAPREVGPELLQSQVEIDTPVCRTLDEVAGELTRLRRRAAGAASAAGCRAVSCGTAPFGAAPDPVPATDEPHYRTLAGDTPASVHQHATCAMHVHVAVPGPELGVEALNRVRPWLSVLMAMAANSPLRDGRDTGFASWRSLVCGRWPVSGLPPEFSDADAYRRATRALRDSGAIRGPEEIYWHARLSHRYPTLEVRSMDVQLGVDDAVLLAGVVRGLVLTALDDARARRSALWFPRPVLAAADWRAARDGLDAELVDPRTGRPAPAAEVVDGLLRHVDTALRDTGDLERVTTAARRLLDRGTGASRQRAALRTGGTRAVAELVGL